MPVAGHVGRLAQRRGDEPISHDKQSIVDAWDVFFHHDIGAFLPGGIIGAGNLLLGGKVGGDAPAVISILGFDHNGRADFQGGRPGIVGA